jgi:ribosomal protein S18 acetylase RimI-like enzyme
MSASLLIRSASEADLEAVRLLLRETWHQVYDAILGPDGVDEVCARWHAPALLREQLHQPRSSFLVAHDSEDLAGHGFAYPSEPATLVISRLYVRPGHQRRGIGTELLAALTARHRYDRLRLFVAEANVRGVAFWRRQGFSIAEYGIEEGARIVHMEKPRSG